MRRDVVWRRTERGWGLLSMYLFFLHGMAKKLAKWTQEDVTVPENLGVSVCRKAAAVQLSRHAAVISSWHSGGGTSESELGLGVGECGPLTCSCF
jgi:hypothetical protein